MERLRRKLEALKAAEAEAPETGEENSKLIRLPRRPRRMTEEASERPHQYWRPDGGSIYDPEPTRPVLRSELQRETGWWPVDQGPARHPSPEHDPDSTDDASVIDLAARRKRAAEDAPAPGTRRMPKPRRITPSPAEGSDTDQHHPDSPHPDEPPRRH